MKKLTVLFTLISGLVLMAAVNVFAADYNYVSGTQTVNLSAGTYNIEDWGSQGPRGQDIYDMSGNIAAYGGDGGYGGYAKGTLSLSSPANLYINGTNGTIEVRLNADLTANRILVGGVGGVGGDPQDSDGYLINGDPGNPGTALALSPLTNKLTPAGTRTGAGLVRITQVPFAIYVSTPITTTSYSAQTGYTTITVSGRVSDSAGGNVTVSGAINGKTKSQVVNSVPSVPPTNDNFTLTWDVVGDALAEGSYSSVTLSGTDGFGGTVNQLVEATLKVDKSAPTLGALSATSIQKTSIAVQTSTTDVSGPVQYQFNINGSDVGTWQTFNTYNFTSLASDTTFTIKYKAKDTAGNTSAYSNAITATTLPAVYTDYNYANGSQAVNLTAGIYRIEAWGSQGAKGADIYMFNGPTYYGGTGGYGGYAKGTLTTNTPVTLYINGTGGTEEIRLNADLSVNKIVVGGAGGDGGDALSDPEYSWYSDGSPGTPGTGATYAPMTSTSTSSGVRSGAGMVRITLMGSLTPSAPTASAIAGGLTDVSNNNNPSDIRIMFRGAADETKIQEYRVVASKAVLDANTAAGLGTASYAVEPLKGRGRLHLFTLPSGLKDNAGNNITKDTGSYTIYLLSYAKTGSSHSIVSLGTIGLDPNIPLTGISAPTVSDIANAGDSSDLRVTFKGPKVESDIQEYRIFVWNTLAPAFDLTAANAVSGVNRYKVVTVGSGSKNGYTVTLPAGMLDTRGGTNTIANGQSYKIYILAVMNKTGKGNMLSSPSKVITLLSTVPSALPVRDLTAVKVGSGHMGSNISVTFSEPLTVSNVQEYRIFICTGAGTLDAATATGLGNTRYIKLDSTGRGAPHTVTLTGLNNIYDGTALGAGDYKVYVLTVGKTSTYAGKLTGPSRLVKLD